MGGCFTKSEGVNSPPFWISWCFDGTVSKIPFLSIRKWGKLQKLWKEHLLKLCSRSSAVVIIDCNTYQDGFFSVLYGVFQSCFVFVGKLWTGCAKTILLLHETFSIKWPTERIILVSHLELDKTEILIFSPINLKLPLRRCTAL